MITPSTVRAAVNLFTAAADLAQGAAASAPARPPAIGATYVPSDGTVASLVQAAVVKGQRTTGGTRASTRKARGPTGAGYAKAPVRTTPSKTTAAKTTASKSDPLSFLKDPKLSIEEKLMRLMGFLNARWDKEMQAKLEKIGAGEQAAQSASTSRAASKKKGGLLGSVTAALKGALGPAGIALEALKTPAVRAMVKKIGGPVLAAAASALGAPALAPLLLKHGPGLIEAAAGVASSLGGAEVSGGATSSSASGTKAMSDSDRQMLVMEIQRIQEKQKEMFGLVSGILKSNHDSRMSVINNIR